jgi:hypothetical protein
MTTALEIVNGAAEEIGVKVAEQDLQAEDYQTIFTRMNDMLLEWADAGITPAFQEVFNAGDIVLIDDNARRAVKTNLAISCAPSFQKIVTQALALVASDSFDRLSASVDFIGEIAYPDTLPMGSGNHCPGLDTNERFFPNNKRDNF